MELYVFQDRHDRFLVRISVQDQQTDPFLLTTEELLIMSRIAQRYLSEVLLEQVLKRIREEVPNA